MPRVRINTDVTRKGEACTVNDEGTGVLSRPLIILCVRIYGSSAGNTVNCTSSQNGVQPVLS
jgi:hypothetical protein